MSKSVRKFLIYRFHLTPVTTKQAYEYDSSLTPEKVKENKNQYLQEVLDSSEQLLSTRGKLLPHLVIGKDGVRTIWKVGNRQKVTLNDSNFESHTEFDYPNILVVFNNEHGNQYLAIEQNTKAFQSPEYFKESLVRHISLLVKRKGLNFTVNPVIESKDFWELLKKHEGRIKEATFDISTNDSNSRATFKEEAKKLFTSTNSVNSMVKLEAPENGVLENLTQENKQFKDLAELVQEGNTNMSFRASGVKLRVTTGNSVKEVEIENISGNGNRFWKSIDKLFK